MKTLMLMIAICAGLTVAGCGGDDSTAQTTEAAKTKPKVTVPTGAPPEELEVNDLVEGSGDEATAGDKVTVQYVGVEYRNGKEFYSSWDKGESPFSFEVGAGKVIDGWDQGIEEMKVGGRRELIIPPNLAYGKEGIPPSIGPNETLVLVMDLLEVEQSD